MTEQEIDDQLDALDAMGEEELSGFSEKGVAPHCLCVLSMASSIASCMLLGEPATQS